MQLKKSNGKYVYHVNITDCLSTKLTVIINVMEAAGSLFESKSEILDQKGRKKESLSWENKKIIELLTNMIIKNCQSEQENLCMTWNDNKKVFYSVPHQRILKVLNSLSQLY